MPSSRRQPIRPILFLTLAAACRAAPEPLPAPLLPTTTLVAAPPARVALAPSLPATLDSLARAAVADSVAPGVVMAVGRYGRLVYMHGEGHDDWARGSPAADGTTLYDMASLTKVVATTTAAMILEEGGLLHVDSTVAHYLPELAAVDPAKRAITVRMLLTHSGGMEAFAPLHVNHRGRAQYLEQIAARPLQYAPGTGMVYSDWDFILMQLVIERITGQTLDAFTAERVFRPLGMHDTGFLPDPSLRPRMAPTAVDTARGGLLWGVVHDENAYALGGVAGHAGLFSTARDLATFAQFMLNGGSYGGVRLLTPQTIARWTSPQLPGSSRALGWDTPSPPSSAGRFAGPRTFGHTGFTGTSIWVDPVHELFVIILTNRVNSHGMTTGHVALRRAVADAVERAVLDAPVTEWERPAQP